MSTTAEARSSSIQWKRRDPPVESSAAVKWEGATWARDDAVASGCSRTRKSPSNWEISSFTFLTLAYRSIRRQVQHVYVEWLVHEELDLERDADCGFIHRHARTTEIRVGHTEARTLGSSCGVTSSSSIRHGGKARR